MGCSVGVEWREEAMNETLGRDKLSGHSGVVLIVANRILECS